MYLCPQSITSRTFGTLLLLGLLSIVFVFCAENHLLTAYKAYYQTARSTPEDNIPSEHDDHTVKKVFSTIPSSPDLTIGPYLQKVISKKSRTAQIKTLDGKKCEPTSQVQIVEVSSTNTNTTKLYMQSLDKSGNHKVYGGDEFVIIFVDSKGKLKIEHNPYTASERFTAYAVATDNDDGTYDLDFAMPPMTHNMNTFTGNGTIYITLEYTCGHGRMTKPMKKKWLNGAQLVFQKKHNWYDENVTNFPTQVIRSYEPTPSVDIHSNFDTIICFGDSLVLKACGVAFDEYEFRIEKLQAVMRNCGHRLSNRNHTKENSQSIASALSDVMQEFGSILNDATQRTAIITGSAAWDAFSNLYENSLDFHEALHNNQYLIQEIQKMFPHTSILWRGPSAIHLGVLSDKCKKRSGCVDRVRYMSNSVTRYLNKKQKDIVKEFQNVYYIDVWEMSYLSGHWHMNGDSQHMRKWLQYLFVDQLLPLENRRNKNFNKTNWMQI